MSGNKNDPASMEELLQSVHGTLVSLSDLVPDLEHALKVIETGFRNHLEFRLRFYGILNTIQEYLKSRERNDTRTQIDSIRLLDKQLREVVHATSSEDEKPDSA